MSVECPNVKFDIFFGHVEIVTTQRWEGRTLILGGYAIHYDKDGNETHRTPNTENCRCTFPEPETRRRWWELW